MQLGKLEELAERYDCFISDIYGVLHDGIVFAPDALGALEYLKKKGKIVALLSNSPRRLPLVAESLTRWGFAQGTHYDVLMTSGEAAFRFLSGKKKERGVPDGRFYTYIGDDFLFPLLADLNLKAAKTDEEIAQSDFGIIAGFESDVNHINDTVRTVEKLMAKSIPIICPNPDHLVLKGDEDFQVCAGSLAAFCEIHLGTKIEYVGKPHPYIYKILKQEILVQTGFRVAEGNAIAVGDSLDNDILGAHNNQLDSLLVLSGLLYRRVNNPNATDAILRVCHEHGVEPPTYVSAALALSKK